MEILLGIIILVYHSGLLNNNTASLGQEIYIDSINYTGVDAANTTKGASTL